MTFHYTHSATELNSSAVDAVYYHRDSMELAVVLNSGNCYVYDDVPQEVFDKFTDTGLLASAGRHYAKTVKREYGPGEDIGYVNEWSFREDHSVPAPSMEAVGTPKGLVDVSSGSANTGTVTYYNLTVQGQGDTGNSSGAHLHAEVPAGVQRKHEVRFSIEGVSGSRFYSTEAGSVEEAINSLTQATDALGLDATVEQVVVFFE